MGIIVQIFSPAVPIVQAAVMTVSSSRLRSILALAAVVLTNIAISLLLSRKNTNQLGPTHISASDACPQVPALVPENPLDIELDELYATSSFRLDAYAALSGAIQVPCVSYYDSVVDYLHDTFRRHDLNPRCSVTYVRSTESYDDMRPVGQDPRWAVFTELHHFLERRFSLVCVAAPQSIISTGRYLWVLVAD